MASPVTESQSYKNFTSTTTLSVANIKLLGIFVASTSGGTLKISDGTTTVVNTFTPAAATFYPLPAICGTSLVITVGGTLDATAFYTV